MTDASRQAASARSLAGKGDKNSRIRSIAQERFTAVGRALASMSQVALSAASDGVAGIENVPAGPHVVHVQVTPTAWQAIARIIVATAAMGLVVGTILLLLDSAGLSADQTGDALLILAAGAGAGCVLNAWTYVATAPS